MISTSLIIPAYNEESRLGPFLESIALYLAANPEAAAEVLLVDDGSTDKTVAVASSFIPKIPILRILQHPENRGKGAAVQTGVFAATYDRIVFMDADGATPITELPKMHKALDTADVAVGNRWMKGAQTERSSALRHISGWSYRNYMSLFGLRSIDTMCGFKGYQSAVAKKLFSNLLEERWLFDTEVAYKAVKAQYSIANFPIKWRSQDGSKLDTKTLLMSAFQIWPLLRRINKQQA